jgi:hypothetical protein
VTPFVGPEARRLLLWFGVALLLHVPLATPLWRALPRDLFRKPYTGEALTEIPIELAALNSAADEPAPAGKRAPATAAAEATEAPPAAAPRRNSALRASAPAGAAPRAPEPRARAPRMGALGDAPVAGEKAPVRLLIHLDRLRGHWLGERLAELLGESAALEGFFAASGLEPLEHFDRAMLAASQLQDSRGSIAVLQYNAPRFRVRTGIIKLGSQSDVAFALPAPYVLVAAPSGAKPKLEQLPRSFRLPEPSGDEGLILQLLPGGRATQLAGHRLPPSLRWAALELAPRAGAGALLRIRAEAAAPGRAERAAAELTAWLKGALSIGAPELRAGEASLEAEVTLSRAELHSAVERVLALLGAPASPTAAAE